VANNGHLPAALILSSGILLFIRTSTMSVTAPRGDSSSRPVALLKTHFDIVWISASLVLDSSDQADDGEGHALQNR
jgi:hypothetical protein